MSELLSREEILFQRPEMLNEQLEGKQEYNKGWNDCVAFYNKIIRETPVSYDLDAVLERLERLKRTNEVNQCYATAMGFRQAIEIVKDGIKYDDEAESAEEADE